MEFPYLAQIIDLISTYTSYKTNAEIGAAVGVKEATIRTWCGKIGTQESGHVPDASAEKLIEFIRGLLPDRPSREIVIQFLQSHPIYFHNALCPIVSRGWNRLLSDRLSPTPLTVDIKPPAVLRFGEVEGVEEHSDWQIVPGSRYAFRLPATRQDGEALVLAECRGEWRPTLFDLKSPTTPVSGKSWLVPSPWPDGRPRFIRNDGTRGIIRYVVIAVSGKFPSLVRDALAATVPYGQMTLDTLGDALSRVPAETMVAAATVFKVGPTPSPPAS